jgi:uncharacterized protein (DUF1697 family)
MARHVAFLRGMNLGGRRISNADLRAHVEALGFDEVAIFRASGNVVVDAPARQSPQRVAERIEQGLEAALGYAVPVFLRTAAQVEAIAAAQPFDADMVAAAEGKIQVSLLGAAPSAAVRKQALVHASDEDRLALDGTELYWLPRGRMVESALDLKALDKLLGPSTMRTKGTIELLAAKHCG